MKLAVVGSGISGLVAAHRLGRQHDVTVYEANGDLGGHTNTIDVDIDGARLAVDTGFIVFNDWTYPNFIRLLRELGVESRATSMSFSVHCDECGLEYNGTSLNGLFAQRSNLLRPKFYRMLRDILRFNREAPAVIDDDSNEDLTVAEYVWEQNYSREFVRHYLLPMGAAIWSCPTSTFEQFPIRFIVEFYRNHGMLNIWDRPTWRVIRGGSRTYVDEIRNRFPGTFRLNTPVVSAARFEDRVELTDGFGKTESFDEVIFACHSDQALRMLSDASRTERALLGAFRYEPNEALLHTDASVLPERHRAWAAWNYRVGRGDAMKASVTYNMNILQHLPCSATLCVSLNDADGIDESKVIRRIQYSHPVFTTQRLTAHQRHTEVIRERRTSFCGAYWGYGFHEDGVNSAPGRLPYVRTQSDSHSCRSDGLKQGEADNAQLPV